jgi:GNAT superfamily N-acetyltransferase
MATDSRLQLDRQRFPFYRHSDASFFLATNDNSRVIGRIAVLDHRHKVKVSTPQAQLGTGKDEAGHQKIPQEDAFFYLFDSVDSLEVAKGLFEAASAWAIKRGLSFLVGPIGFAAGDPLGLLVEGFEHRAAMGISYNHSYYGRLAEACDFSKEFDLVSCHMTTESEIPDDKIHQLADWVKQRRGLRVVSFRSKRELRAVVPKIKQVYNETLGAMERNSPLTEEEIDAVADRMMTVAEPGLIKIVMRDDEMIGFLFAFPDLSAAIQRCKGRLWPTGWFWLLREYKRTSWVDLNGMAVVPKYQGLGATLVLYSEMIKTLQTGRFTDADLVQVRDNNPKMIAELERMGAPVYKRHRVYRKSLADLIDG